jgi:hypothetical protein
MQGMMPARRQLRIVNTDSSSALANVGASISSPFPWRMNFLRGFFSGSFAIRQRALPNLRLIYKQKIGPDRYFSVQTVNGRNSYRKTATIWQRGFLPAEITDF